MMSGDLSKIPFIGMRKAIYITYSDRGRIRDGQHEVFYLDLLVPGSEFKLSQGRIVVIECTRKCTCTSTCNRWLWQVVADN